MVWTQISPVGGYDGLLDPSCGPNPIQNSPAFIHDSGGVWVQRQFDLSSFRNNVVRLRFHAGFDCGNCQATTEVWHVDEVRIFEYLILNKNADTPPLIVPPLTTNISVLAFNLQVRFIWETILG